MGGDPDIGQGLVRQVQFPVNGFDLFFKPPETVCLDRITSYNVCYTKLLRELYLPHQALPDIRVTTHKSRLYHSTAIADRIRPAVHDRLFSKDIPRHHDVTGPAGTSYNFV